MQIITNQKIITPPQCIGIMGGGQLARMLSIAVKQMGYKVAILEPETDCPAKQFADYHIVSNYDDLNGLDQLIQKSDVITTEFENVPASSMKYLSKSIGTYPDHKIISIAQNRLAEKQFFNSINISTVKFIQINGVNDTINDTKYVISSGSLDNCDTLDIFPAILKTNTLGYDGKGQIRVNNTRELQSAFAALGGVECILEQMIDIKKEVSIIVARNHLGVSTYPIVENTHKNGILDFSIAKKINANSNISYDVDTIDSKINTNLNRKIAEYAINIVNKLDYIGVLAIEFFITQNDEILANEIAPRPHNSGHHTIDTCITSQFEQQLRATCNLKLGDTCITNNSIMLNILGDIWQTPDTPPSWDKILTKYDNIKLHLYDKKIAKLGRKMGHLTLIGSNDKCEIDDITDLTNQMLEIKTLLGISA